MSKMIRIDTETYEKIVSIQSLLGSTKQSVVQKAVDRFNKDLLLSKIDAEYKKLRRNKKAWAQELAERKEWESLNDGLDND